jgi:hypothetical protein
MHRRLSLPALALLGALGIEAARAQALPPSAASLVPQVRESGQGRLKWWGLHIYDARLFTSGAGLDANEPFALALRYARDFDGARIADTSLDEMRRLGFGTDADHRRWRETMATLFPDVKRGDELTGVFVPGRGMVFFHNARRLGEVEDQEFARAFFAIWLDPRTRATELRQRLLGEAG